LLKRRLWVTLELTFYTVPILLVLGIWLGTISGIYHDKLVDHATRFGAIVFWSLPNFLFALILLMIFYGYLHLFPPGVINDELYRFILDNPDKYTHYTHFYTIDGLLNGRPDITWDAFKHLVLPVISLVLVIMALFVRLMRATMIEEISKDYIITGLAKGADKKTVYYKHARKNALIPIVTVSGTLIAFLIQGEVMEEVVFNRSGMGMWLAYAAVQLDIPALMGIVILTSLLMVFTNLVVDVLCAYIDPRIRLD
jgi:peptide/nickel transport system permease protein